MWRLYNIQKQYPYSFIEDILGIGSTKMNAPGVHQQDPEGRTREYVFQLHCVITGLSSSNIANMCYSYCNLGVEIFLSLSPNAYMLMIIIRYTFYQKLKFGIHVFYITWLQNMVICTSDN